jgi:hypothetical protein
VTNLLTHTLVTLTLWITGFLVLLNVVCAILFRRRRPLELFFYVTAAALELGIFVLSLLFHVGVLTHLPYHLPPGLPFDLAEIGAAVAVGIGLFPVSFWHRTSATQLRARIAKDAQDMQQHQGTVRVRSNAPGEWMN